MSIGAGVIVAIALQQVDDTPNGQTGTQGDNESLENTNYRSEKCHNKIPLKVRMLTHRPQVLDFQLSFQKFNLVWFLKVAILSWLS